MQNHYEKGLQKLKEGKYSEALINFDKALAENPYDASCMSDKAVALFHLDKKAESLALLDHAQKLEPANPYRYSSRAFVKDAMGDLQGAILDYQKAIELDPEDMVAYNNLGLIEEKLGYKEAAKKKFAEADALAKKLGIDFDEDGNFVSSKSREDIPSATSGQRNEQEEGDVSESMPPIRKKIVEQIAMPPMEEQASAGTQNLTPKNYLQVFKEVFTSKKVFNEFINFVLKKK
ncbi:MAG: tetratricopeptide repeat protein [Cytophagales bacterium]|nr:MAG: tetratricopeptide repeat protein [Cytophagales bacterium]